jgi:hypothetical protein
LGEFGAGDILKSVFLMGLVAFFSLQIFAVNASMKHTPRDKDMKDLTKVMERTSDNKNIDFSKVMIRHQSVLRQQQIKVELEKDKNLTEDERKFPGLKAFDDLNLLFRFAIPEASQPSSPVYYVYRPVSSADLKKYGLNPDKLILDSLNNFLLRIKTAKAGFFASKKFGKYRNIWEVTLNPEVMDRDFTLTLIWLPQALEIIREELGIAKYVVVPIATGSILMAEDRAGIIKDLNEAGTSFQKNIEERFWGSKIILRLNSSKEELELVKQH